MSNTFSAADSSDGRPLGGFQLPFADLPRLELEKLLDEFVHVGMDENTVERIGELPHGRGILGLLIRHPVPVRLADLAAHPAAARVPAPPSRHGQLPGRADPDP